MVLAAVREQLGDSCSLSNFPYHITYRVFMKSRKMDIGNVSTKAITDGLVLCGIFPDDSLRYVQAETIIFGGTDSKNPRIEIEIEEMESK